MPATKVVTVLANNTSLTTGTFPAPTEGDTNGSTSSIGNLSADYAATILIRMANAAVSTFTTPAQVRVEVSGDQTNWYSIGPPVIGVLSNAGVKEYRIPLSQADMYVRTRSGGNTGTGADVTLRVAVERVTAI